jgi:hypothetical protein
MYAKGAPINLEYNLKLHIKNSFYVGTDIRLKDAIALIAGVTILGKAQIGYSYDFVTFPLSTFQKGTHEITLAYKTNLEPNKKYRKGDGFQHQRYFLF